MLVPTAKSMILSWFLDGWWMQVGRMASWSSAAASGKDQLPSRESWCGFITSLVLSSAISNRKNHDHILNDGNASNDPYGCS